MKYGLVGLPLAQSFSPFLHQLLGSAPYELCEMTPERLEDFFEKRDFIGVNVTIPYKKTVLPFLDEVSPLAREIGSVNTVWNKNGRLFGENTDFYGLCALLEREQIDLLGKTVFILGSGGTAATAKAVAKKKGAKRIFTVSRTPTGDFLSYEKAQEMGGEADVLINTTPCGMVPDTKKAPLSLEAFPNLSAVVDVIYRPLRTRLLLMAEERGIKTAGGLYMLAAQAARSAALFLGTAVPAEKAEALYEALLEKERNVVLIGLPASGKTTVGRLLAEKWGKEFVDGDEVLEKRFGAAVPTIFREKGEAFFRKEEEQALIELSQKRGAVIATGGGAVLSEEAMTALRQSGALVFLNRPLEKLAIGPGRPTAPDREALFSLSKERRPLYEKWADFSVCGDKTAEEIADEIWETLKK